MPEDLPPPKAKPRYRFVVAFSTILLLAFASMAIVAAIFPEQGPQARASGDPTGPGNPVPSNAAGHMTTMDTPPAGAVDNTTVNPPSAPAAGAVSGTFQVSQDWN